MNEGTARQFGSALFWQALQMVGVKVIFLLRTIVLARLLVPDDFGLLAIALIAVDFLVVVTNIGMIPALVQHRQPRPSHYDAAWTVGLLRALLITTVVILAAPLIADIFREPRAVALIRVAALRPILEAAASIRIAELTRALNFRALTLIRLPDAIANTVLSIVLAPWLGVWALLVGLLAGPLAYVLFSYLLAPYRPHLYLDRAVIRPLIQFGRWIFLIGVVSAAGRSILQATISRQLGTAELGLYFLAAKLALIPAEVASEVIGTVAFPLYARLQEDARQMARAYRAILTGMTMLLAPVTVLLITLAPQLVAFVLGARWEGTVALIQVLALVNILGLLGDTITPILNGAGQPHRVLIVEIVQSLLLVVLAWVLVARWGVVGAALTWLPAIGVSQALSAYYVSQVVPRPFAGLGRTMMVIVAASLLGALLAVGVTGTVPGLAGFVLAGGLAATLMASLFWLADRTLHLGLQADLVRVFPQVTWLARLVPSK